MNKEEIEKQLKLSKRQNKDKRYDYLDSEFNAINYCIKLEKYTNKLLQENQELKEQVDYLRRSIERKEETIIDSQNERVPYTNEYVAKLENQQKEFIEYLENEKDRLARECSRIYVDSLGKTRLVSEDIYDEVDKILSKYKESCK